jgi:hypothetical protein
MEDYTRTQTLPCGCCTSGPHWLEPEAWSAPIGIGYRCEHCHSEIHHVVHKYHLGTELDYHVCACGAAGQPFRREPSPHMRTLALLGCTLGRYERAAPQHSEERPVTTG